MNRFIKCRPFLYLTILFMRLSYLHFKSICHTGRMEKLVRNECQNRETIQWGAKMEMLCGGGSSSLSLIKCYGLNPKGWI